MVGVIVVVVIIEVVVNGGEWWYAIVVSVGKRVGVGEVDPIDCGPEEV
jgi:hypothetical protein